MLDKYGKIIAIIAGLIMIPLSLMQAIDIYKTKTAELEAIVQYHVMFLDPAILEGIENLSDLSGLDGLSDKIDDEELIALSKLNIEKNLDSYHDFRDHVRDIKWEIVESIREIQRSARVITHNINRKIIKIDGVINAKVKNEGVKAAEKIKLNIRGCVSASILKKGSKDAYKENCEVVELGELQSQESVEIIAWVSAYTRLSSNDITLSYKEGAGKIVLIETASPLWVWMSKYWGSVAYGVFMCFLLINLLKPTKKRQSDTKKNDGENK